MNEFISFFTNILNFSGKASRKEFIIPLVAILIISFLLGGLIGGVIGTILAVIVFISAISISVRRLHDCGNSGLWVLLYLIPIANIILLIYLCVKPGK
ncbi:DUF805 domain-containing protein [bacterium]|nr:DUF805 domain-containing protein [bacterium]